MLNQSKPEVQENLVLALEFGASAIKLIKVKWSASTPELVRADRIAIPEHLDREEEEKLWKEALHKLLANEDLNGQALLVSINSPHTCFGRFVIPKIPHKEINDILKWKMQESVAFEPQEAVLDYRLLEIPGTEKEPRFVALTSVTPRDTVDRYFRVLVEAGIPNFIPVYSVFSLDHLKDFFTPIGSSLVAVLDVGHSMTELCFYDNGKLAFVRKLGFGSQLISNALTQSLASERGTIALSREEALQILDKENLFVADPTRLAGGKIEIPKLFALIRPELEKLSSELERSLDFFTQEHSKSVGTILVSGGFSRMEGLCSFLGEELELPVIAVKPESFIKLKDEFDARGFPSFFRLVNCIFDRRGFDLIKTSDLEKKVQKLVKVLSVPQAAVASLSILLLLVCGLVYRDIDFRRKISQTQAQIQNLEPGFEFAQKIRSLEAQISNAKSIIQSLSILEPDWRETFKELSHAIPSEVVVSNFDFQNGTFILKGIVFGSNSQTVLSNTIIALQGPIFAKVTLLSVEQKPELKQAMFSLRCEL